MRYGQGEASGPSGAVVPHIPLLVCWVNALVPNMVRSGRSSNGELGVGNDTNFLQKGRMFWQVALLRRAAKWGRLPVEKRGVRGLP